MVFPSHPVNPSLVAKMPCDTMTAFAPITMGSALPHIKAGKVKALGVSTRQRVPVLPEVPPIADAVPGYEVRGWNGILAPAGTPRAVIDRLHKEFVRIVRSSEFAEPIATEGAVAVGNTPE